MASGDQAASVYMPKRNVPLRSFKLSLEDVKRIYDRLDGQIREQAKWELSKLARPAEKTEEQFSEDKAQLEKTAFKLTVTVFGREDGETLFADNASVFESPNLPNKIDSIYITNVTAYQAVVSVKPTNFVE